MSSRFTKPIENHCPDCGGILERAIVTETYHVEGRDVLVSDLLPYRCLSCRTLVWTEAELRRAREAVALKLRKLAA
ncbi:MAG: hypothetical protein HY814_13645 [Candidatus Riflebacteria bacterium]|nr:hypothetical protein [Candidatus Riflebacteria bacterium]